jgi:uncharacterized membrane protein YuzA (DUF378 family)
MNETQRLLYSAVTIAALSQALAIVDTRSNWVLALLVALNLLVCVLGYRTGRHRIYWLIWGIVTIAACFMLGLSNPVSLLRIGLGILFGI